MEVFFLLIYLFFYIIAALKLKTALYLYVLFIPLRDLTDIHILGLFSPNTVFYFILFFHFFKRGYFHNLAKYFKNPNLKPLSLFVIVFLLTVYILRIKDGVLFEDYRGIEISGLWIINRTITSFLHLINLLVIINICFLYKPYRRTAYSALVFSSIVVTLSLYFAPFLDSIGINVRDEIDHSISGIEGLGRVAGLYQGGDANSTSIFLNLVIAFLLVNHAVKRKSLTFWPAVLFAFLASGILITASRMGFVTLLATSSYYFFFLNLKIHKFTIRAILNIFVLLLAGGVLIYLITQHDRFGLVLGRIEQQGITDEVVETGHRYIRWMGFIEHSMSKASWFLFGSNEIYYAFVIGDYRDPHNLFIRILYINGFFVLLLFVWFFICFVFSLRRLELLGNSILIILTILISMMIISSFNNLNVFSLMMGLLVHEKLYTKYQYSVKQHGEEKLYT